MTRDRATRDEATRDPATRRRSAAGRLAVAALVLAIGLKAAGVISQQALDHVLLASIAWAAFGLSARAGAGPTPSALAAGALAGGLVALQAWQPGLQYMPYLAVAPVNLALGYVFARGLMPGRRPALIALVESTGRKPVDDPSFRRYLAGQCAVWSLLALATGLVAMAAMVAASARGALSAGLGALIGAQVLLFLASHHYAAIRYGRPERWRDTLRAMARVDLWSSLRAQ